MLLRELSNFLKRAGAENGAGRITRRIEDEDASTRRDLRGDLLQVRLKMIFLFQPKRYGRGSKAARKRGINRKARIGIEHIVAGFYKRHHGEGKRHLASRSHEDLFGRDAEPSPSASRGACVPPAPAPAR